MKNYFKKMIFFAMVIACVATIVFLFIRKSQKEDIYEEYEPQEEISEEQERQTLVSLYFINKSTRNVEPEARLVDVKELVISPYETLINMLIQGPKTENHEKAIPEGTKLLGATIEGEVLKLDFSEEFVQNHIGGREEEEKTIETIVNTLTELTEVNSIRILINGEENKQFNDGEINFSLNFIRDE